MKNVELPQGQNEPKENGRTRLTQTEFEELVCRALLEVNRLEYEAMLADVDATEPET